jgi:hypothetical protein
MLNVKNLNTVCFYLVINEFKTVIYYFLVNRFKSCQAKSVLLLLIFDLVASYDVFDSFCGSSVKEVLDAMFLNTIDL